MEIRVHRERYLREKLDQYQVHIAIVENWTHN